MGHNTQGVITGEVCIVGHVSLQGYLLHQIRSDPELCWSIRLCPLFCLVLEV